MLVISFVAPKVYRLERKREGDRRTSLSVPHLTHEPTGIAVKNERI